MQAQTRPETRSDARSDAARTEAEPETLVGRAPRSDLRAAVREAARVLAAAGVPSPETDAVELAAHAAGVDAGEVRRRMILGDVVPEGFADLVARRATRVPLQHLTGRAAFRRLELRVGPGVFVPRPETELTAGLAIDAARAVVAQGRVPKVADLCAGSGAIALAIKDEVPTAVVHAVELEPDAYAWMERNRDELGLDVELHLGRATLSLLDHDGSFDVVASNPPYIPSGAIPQDPEVRDHDPERALYGGSADGLAIPRLVAARAASLLRPGGVLVMEHADVQGATLPTALQASGSWATIVDHDDLAGRPRSLVAVRGED